MFVSLIAEDKFVFQLQTTLNNYVVSHNSKQGWRNTCTG